MQGEVEFNELAAVYVTHCSGCITACDNCNGTERLRCHLFTREGTPVHVAASFAQLSHSLCSQLDKLPGH